MSSRRHSTPKFRPNPKRQAILIGLALVGLGLGYGIGYVFKPEPKPAPPPPAQEKPPPVQSPVKQPAAAAPAVRTPKVVLPEIPATPDADVRPYEEALPKEITVTVVRIGQRPAENPPQEEKSAAAPETASEPTPKTAAAAPTVPPAEAAPAEPAAEAATPSAPAVPADPPAWRRHAVAVNLDERPKIAVVMDDLGVDRARTRRTIGLKGPLTMAFLPYAGNLEAQTQAARGAGHELWMHVPMEPSSKSVDPGPNVLLSGVAAPETLASLRWNLAQFSGFVGINNHMGSRFTADLAGMRRVMAELATRELAFLDSVTSGSSVGRRAAEEAGIPYAIRNVFIDHEDDIPTIQGQLQKIETLARRQGHAIAIGHPRESTLKALKPWLETIENKGFQLVPVSSLLSLPPASAEAR